MTDSDTALDAIGRVAADLLPELSERLSRHGLGELEVADGDLRLRVRAGPAGAPLATPVAADTTPAAGAPARHVDPAGEAEALDAAAVPVGSPAVGFFVYADGLGPGLEVATGDALGHVEMLGVRHEVRAPRGGTVRSLVAESGEAVEYGQTVLEIEAPGTAR